MIRWLSARIRDDRSGSVVDAEERCLFDIGGASFQGNQPVGIIGNVGVDHIAQNFAVMDAVLAVQLPVELFFANDSVFVKEYGGASGARGDIAQVINHPQNGVALVHGIILA